MQSIAVGARGLPSRGCHLTEDHQPLPRHVGPAGWAGVRNCGGPGEPCAPGNLPYFRPNDPTTRGQIAKIVSSAKGYSDTPSGQTFQDVPPGSPFYPWIQRLASRNVMGGYACGGPGEPCAAGNLPYFRPGANATRAQVSKIVANTFFPECNP